MTRRDIERRLDELFGGDNEEGDEILEELHERHN